MYRLRWYHAYLCMHFSIQPRCICMRNKTIHFRTSCTFDLRNYKTHFLSFFNIFKMQSDIIHINACTFLYNWDIFVWKTKLYNFGLFVNYIVFTEIIYNLCMCSDALYIYSFTFLYSRDIFHEKIKLLLKFRFYFRIYRTVFTIVLHVMWYDAYLCMYISIYIWFIFDAVNKLS